MSVFDLQKSPFIVPTQDAKLIQEHFGLASIDRGLSLAEMIAPPGWSEPFQRPSFEEYTLVLKGAKLIELEGEKIVLSKGQSIRISPDVRVRYSNPFEQECRYISICRPPFSMETVRREEAE